MGCVRLGLLALTGVAWAGGASSLRSSDRDVRRDGDGEATRTEIYVWPEAVFFAPPGADVAASDPPGRRRLGDYDNDYKKPEPQDSSKDCFRVAQKIRDIYSVDPESGDATGCMACDPTIGAPIGTCPVSQGGAAYDCQDLVDEMYHFCSGEKGFFFMPDERPKRMPDGFFYDPLDTISGKWTDEVQNAVKISVEKCGCNAGTALGPRTGLAFAAALVALFFAF